MSLSKVEESGIVNPSHHRTGAPHLLIGGGYHHNKLGNLNVEMKDTLGSNSGLHDQS